jgi:hypothetical protein
MVVWSVGFNIAFADGSKASVEAVQDKAGVRLVIGTSTEFDMAIRLPKFAEFLNFMGVGGVSFTPSNVVSYDFRFSSLSANGQIHVCGSNEDLGANPVFNDPAIFDDLKADSGFREFFASGSAILINSLYVDYGPGDTGAEASNLIAGLEEMGKTIRTFTDVSEAGLLEAISGMSHLIIPELENYEGDGTDIFSAEAADVLRSYASSGNTLITFSNSEEVFGMLNHIFDWSISEGSEGSPAYVKTESANNYGYTFGPESIPSLDATGGVGLSTLPPGSAAIYKNETDSCALAIVPYGQGRVILFGWDWYSAVPVGEQDDGWLTLLDIATD